MKGIQILLFMALSISGQLLAQGKEVPKSKVVADGAALKLVSKEYKFTEGPAADAEGNVFFTDQPNNRIIKCATDFSLSVYMDSCGRSNGLYFDHEGNLVSCADLKNQLWVIDKNKKVTVLVNDFEGKKLNGPNDLWIDSKGGIYFTDPFYKRDYWPATKTQQLHEDVYYLSPDKKTTKVVANDLVKPNGIIGTANGKKLYVADIGGNKTYVYKINKDGTLSGKTLFAELGSDGMTIDNKGNIYLTGKGVTVFNKRGEQIEHIDVNENWTANVTFGGKDQNILFITASKSLYALPMKVQGVRYK